MVQSLPFGICEFKLRTSYLDLSAVAGSYVADRPSCLLHNVHLGMLQQLGEHWNGLKTSNLCRPMENLLNSLSQVENIRFNLGDFELSRNQPERRELRPFENHFLSQYFQGTCK